MTHPINILRAAVATAVLAGSTAGLAAGASSPSCDPMYPCFTDTPAAVYDLAAHAGDTVGVKAQAVETGLIQDHPSARSPAAVYDLAARTDHAPCQSYPCYPENAAPATPIAADAGMTRRSTDQRI